MRNYEGIEGPKNTIQYEHIKKMLNDNAALVKPDYEDMGRVIQELDLPEKTAAELKNRCSGKIQYHLIRLAKQSEAEKNFCIAYLENKENIFKEDEQTNKEVIEVINSEGYDTMMFWTFAPYLYKCLKERGIADEEAIKRVLQWSKDGVSVLNFDSKPGQDFATLHLKGLEKFLRDKWVLSKDPNHISHKFTEQEARRIVEEFLLTEDEK